MGTNYYHYSTPCPHCGRGEEPRHIGKSSAGWCFLLHVEPDAGITDLDDWRKIWISSGEIRDEYGNVISPEKMEANITQRQWPQPLLRVPLGANCIKHGDGTWDCIVGEFS